MGPSNNADHSPPPLPPLRLSALFSTSHQGTLAFFRKLGAKIGMKLTFSHHSGSKRAYLSLQFRISLAMLLLLCMQSVFFAPF